MSATIIIPLFLGCIGILQGAINRQVSMQIGLAQASLITNLATVIMCTFFYLIVKKNPLLFPSFFQLKAEFFTYKWWYIFPPIFGFLIVTGMPYAISEIGAVKVTVGLIAAQMITSVIWDYFVDNITLNPLKIGGIVSALLSVILITLAKK